MTWSYHGYAAAGFSIPFGLGVVIFAVLFYFIRWRRRTFYRMIKAMFSIKHYEATPSDASEFIDIYGVQIGLPSTTFGCLPHLALLIMATAVLTATFVLFLSELILINRYVSPNNKCPLDDEMDCYTTNNNTYFFCNSSDTRIDASLESLACYRWIKQNIGTVDILNQTGLCGGLLQAFGWFVNIFLRLLLHGFHQKKSSLPGSKLIEMKIVDLTLRQRHLFKLCFKLLVVTLITLSPCVVLIVLGAKNISRTGMTMVILSVIFLVAVSGLLLLLTHESTNFKHGIMVANKVNTISSSASEMAFQSVNLQGIRRISTKIRQQEELAF
jgi:hypothetical protein